MREQAAPRIVRAVSGTIETLAVAPDAGGVSEAFIQRLLHESPGILPIDEIGPGWGPIMSLGREISLTVGSVDNLLISPRGDITVVEAKLWRNPESRRKVVGQVLDYAAALSKLSYSELEQKTGGVSIHQRATSAFGTLTVAEDEFHDAVSRNLRQGHFLLLVVGDGIREDLRGIADLLVRRGDLGFHLELVELRVFHLDGGDILVVPSLVGRTSEVVRAVIRVEGGASVSVEIPEPEGDQLSSDSNLESIDAFIDQMQPNVGHDWAEAARELLTWWSEDEGGIYRLNQASITLALPFPMHYSKWAPLMSLKSDGTLMMTGPSFVSRDLLEPKEIQEWAIKNGLTQSRSPLLHGADLSNAETYERIAELLDNLGKIVLTGQVKT